MYALALAFALFLLIPATLLFPGTLLAQVSPVDEAIHDLELETEEALTGERTTQPPAGAFNPARQAFYKGVYFCYATSEMMAFVPSGSGELTNAKFWYADTGQTFQASGLLVDQFKYGAFRFARFTSRLPVEPYSLVEITFHERKVAEEPMLLLKKGADVFYYLPISPETDLRDKTYKQFEPLSRLRLPTEEYPAWSPFERLTPIPN